MMSSATTPAAPGGGAAKLGFDAIMMSNPATAFASGGVELLGEAVEFGKQLVSDFEQMFGIGRGRKEADIIVPKQNQLAAILAKAAAIGADPARTGDELNSVYWVLRQACEAFYGPQFLDHPSYARWPDGRAARQAYQTIQPLADKVLAAIGATARARGSSGSQLANVGTRGDVSAQLDNKLEQLNAIDTGAVSNFGGAIVNGSLTSTGVIALAAVLAAVLLLRRA